MIASVVGRRLIVAVAAARATADHAPMARCHSKLTEAAEAEVRELEESLENLASSQGEHLRQASRGRQSAQLPQCLQAE